MADSIDAAAPPVGYDLYAGYVDGRTDWQSYPGLVARFGSAKVVPIAVFSSTNAGIIGDGEKGDMLPPQLVQWVVMRRRAGVDPTGYCSFDAWGSYKQAFSAAGVPQPHWMIAAYPGIGPLLYTGSVAHQYADVGPNGENIDVSVVANYWPGVDPTPTPPPTLEGAEEMDSVVAPNGDIVSHYRTPQNHLLEVTRKAGTQGEALPAGLSILDLTAEWPQFQVVG